MFTVVTYTVILHAMIAAGIRWQRKVTDNFGIYRPATFVRLSNKV